MVTIKDIAQDLGLAHTTVSRALNDHPHIRSETKQKVREAANRLGYVPNLGARSMRVGASRLVGLIVPDIQNEFFGAVAMALADRCAASDHQLLLGISLDDPERESNHLRLMREGRAQAVLIAPCGRSSPQARALLGDARIIQLLRYDASLGSASIRLDDEGAMRRVAGHLAELGHREIAYLGASESLSTGVERLRGLREGLHAHGLALPGTHVATGRTSPEFGHAASCELLDRHPDLSALVVGSSRQLVGAMRAIHERGIQVPQQLSVVAYGDTDWYAVTGPAITGLSLPIHDMVGFVTEGLFRWLATPHAGQHPQEEIVRVFQGQLIVRESTAPPPAHPLRIP